MPLAIELVIILAIAAATAGLANRFALSAPLLLTAFGLVLSFVPGMPTLPLEPDVVLEGLLPPLLYATAVRTPWVDLRRNKRSIGLLSVGLVLVTAFAVAIVVQMVLPEVPFAIALALGAVVAPPDAVAASAVARRVSMPRRVVTLLEGESLLNDATALVTLRTAIAAISGSVGVLSTGADFVWAVAGGVLTGWLLAQLVTFARHKVEDPVLDTSISLLVPFIAYLAAEEIHGSGVIAVVVAGLMLGHRSIDSQSAMSRVTERVIWRTVQFLLESAVFLLIGLQLQDLVSDAIEDESTPNLDVLLLSGAVLLTVIVVRGLWVFPSAYLPRLLVPAIRRHEPRQPAAGVALVGWAGMRGVVTLAAALTIPEDVPGRPALVVAAFSVVAGTLLIQGTTLPWLVRRLRVVGPDPAQDALQEALLQQQAAQAGLDRLGSAKRENDAADVVATLESWGERVANAAWERLGSTDAQRETPASTFHRLRVEMLEAEREIVATVRSDGSVPHDLVERVLERIDQEEAMLDGFSTGSGPSAAERSSNLTTPRPGACEHLQDRPLTRAPASRPDACPECLKLGEHSWVHLRMCLDCGHVGCCDSSPNRHADAHWRESGHPVMRSIELGESWRWCFEDAELG
ncbi:Na+/H+ antiporter [Kineosporia succinea]|uniref:CPA1 family monovalent cation:H+ antiporter n=1 Tax=Kineosporia succinea TaxID=84632 RepID=A0ABT9P4A5_9ACTN|nr:Na+/H+ antiporter [Kineosporia succinea]MDP9827531.1 CPA1 family monovalent cation:H+ antiporter [Kineosporia succinea]